jgi:urate oxidase
LEKTYYDGDNRDVIATGKCVEYVEWPQPTSRSLDTMKNVLFVLASKHDLNAVEEFALYVATHFFTTYEQVENIFVKIQDHSWTRLHVDGKPDAYSFVRGGPELRFTEVRQSRGKSAQVISGFAGLYGVCLCHVTLKHNSGLEVLKTCGSAFTNFHHCEHTTLLPATDRLLSTNVSCQYEFVDARSKTVVCRRRHTHAVGARNAYNATYDAVKQTLLEQFAVLVSQSVQQLLYRAGVVTLQRAQPLAAIAYQMPNLHYFDYKLPELGLPGACCDDFASQSEH